MDKELEIYIAQIPTHKQKFLNRHKNHWQAKLFEFGKFLAKYLPRNNKGQFMMLDLGCGIGTFALEYAAAGIATVGVDYCVEILKEGSNLVLPGSKATPWFVAARCEKLPFLDNVFELVVASDIVEHLAEPILRQTLEECVRVLKKGGFLFIHTFPKKYYYYYWGELVNKHFRKNPVPHYNYQTTQNLRHGLQMAGFSVLSIYSTDVHHTLKPGNKIKRVLAEKLSPRADLYAISQNP